MTFEYVQQPTDEINATSSFPFVWGSFGIDNWKIPYFSTTMSLEEAARDLDLTSDLPGSSTQDFNLEELFQREINWHRVTTIIAPWLMSAEKPQFFSALTIVILPKSPTENKILQDFSSSHDWKNPPIQGFQHLLPVGPVSVGTYEAVVDAYKNFPQQGRIRWNKSEAFAVAIDGQHRLAAMKYVEKRTRNNALDAVRKMRVPVNVLIFSPEVGFSRSAIEPLDNIQLMRKLFIGLNAHSVKVSRVRNLLLEDSSAHALALRSLLRAKLDDDFSALESEQPQFPLSVIDWQSEKAKFDAGPHLATVHGLDRYVKKLVTGSSSIDPTEYGDIKKLLNYISRSLKIDVTSLLETLEQVEKDSKPFYMSKDDLAIVVSHFKYTWRKPIIKMLTEFTPYANLLKLRKQNQTHTLEWQAWHRLYSLADASNFKGQANQDYEEYCMEISSRVQNPANLTKYENDLSEIVALKKNNELPFSVVFQAAWLYSLRDLRPIESAILENSDEETDFDINADPIALTESAKPFAKSDDDESAQSSYSYEEQEMVEEKAEQYLPSDEVLMFGNKLVALSDFIIKAMNQIVNVWPDIVERDAAATVNGIKVGFWFGSLSKSDAIDFTDAASGRASDLLQVLYLTVHAFNSGKYKKFDDFYDAVMYANDNVTKFEEKVFKRIETCKKNVGMQILRNLDKPDNEDQALDEVRYRMQIIWEKLKSAKS